MNTNCINTVTYLTRKQICGQLNISRTSLWRIQRTDPSFPMPLNLGIKKEQWISSEIAEWVGSTRVAPFGGKTDPHEKGIGKSISKQVLQ
jgi:predicted DNA-binding transcriptional regulator AlpA